MLQGFEKNHFPGRALIVYQATPLLPWGFLSLFRKPKVRIDWGAALCSPNDSWDEEKGADIAVSRLDAYLGGRENLRSRRLAGTFYLPWDAFVQAATSPDPSSIVRQSFDDAPWLLAWPERWKTMVT